ncbi:MAG: DUF4412 domain-containing protein [Mucilaginibacter polytrichastri]|nr:DUF4412 domain-containing protein [Mucilaginibacter polytrichastri]
MKSVKKAAMLALVLTGTAFSAFAQKKISEGTITYTISANGQSQDAVCSFKGDSAAVAVQNGPASIKTLMNDKSDYFAILVDVPVAQKKFAAVATPADQEKFKEMEPEITATATTETQTIAGYKCTKMNAKDAKSGKTFDVWVTKDIEVPVNSVNKYVSKLGGVPVKFSTVQMGQVANVEMKSLKEEKIKPNTFAVPSDFEKITFEQLMSMGGGQR